MILHNCTGVVQRDTGAELRFDSPVDISITSLGSRFMRVNLPAADGIPRVIIPTPDGMKLGCGPRLIEGEILMFAFTGMDEEQRGQKVQYHRTAGPRQRVRILQGERETRMQVFNTCRMKRHLSALTA